MVHIQIGGLVVKIVSTRRGWHVTGGGVWTNAHTILSLVHYTRVLGYGSRKEEDGLEFLCIYINKLPKILN